MYRTVGGGPLYSRLLNEAESSAIAGTDGALNPVFSPDGRWLAFFVGPALTNLQSFDDAQIVVRSLDTGEQHPVAKGSSAQYLPTGHLVYARAGALYAVRFDAARLAVTGAPVKVAEGIITHPDTGAVQVAISRTGTLVYTAGDSRTAELPGDQDRGQWMPDGVHVTFGADTTGSGSVRLFSDRSDGTGSGTLLIDRSESPSPLSWSKERKLLYRQIGATTGEDVWIYSADDRTSAPLLQTAANESSAVFSPDGRWVAYVSDESGRAEVYVRPLSGPVTRTQVSIDGGTASVWSRDGRELFFAKGNALLTAPVRLGRTFTSGPARHLFSGPYGFDEVTVNYDVSPDGQHFIVPRSRIDSAPRQLELVLNWFEELNRLAPK